VRNCKAKAVYNTNRIGFVEQFKNEHNHPPQPHKTAAIQARVRSYSVMPLNSS
jgi:hypothetical protein